MKKVAGFRDRLKLIDNVGDTCTAEVIIVQHGNSESGKIAIIKMLDGTAKGCMATVDHAKIKWDGKEFVCDYRVDENE